MAKVDKSQYTKAQWRAIREERRQRKITYTDNQSVDIPQAKPAFVLGNGVSRQAVEVDDLKKTGTVYGCNALYRTHSPDYLIAVDPKMINEICKNQYQLEHTVWTNRHRSFSRFQGLNYFHPAKGWSSGPTALWLASEHGYETVYILGFDYKGLDNGKKLNNVYANTQNYKRSSDNATFYGNWLRQTKTVIRDHSQTTFVRVIDTDSYSPEELNNFNNFKTVYMENFKKILQNI